MPDIFFGVEVLFLIGAQAAGKSTIANLLVELFGLTVLSTDAIREKLYPGKPYDKSDNARVWEEFYNRMCPLVGKQPFIIDVTNAFGGDRWRLMQHLKGVPVTGLWVDAPLEVCIERDSKRAKPVTPTPIEITHAALGIRPPSMKDGYTRLLHYDSVSGELTRIG